MSDDRRRTGVHLRESTIKALDDESDRRGLNRSKMIERMVEEWRERGDEVDDLRAEVEELRAELAEERTDEDDAPAPWAEQVFGVATAAFAIFGGSTALSWVASVLLSISGAASLAFGLALVATSAFVTALGAGAAMRRAADPAPDEEPTSDEVAG